MNTVEVGSYLKKRRLEHSFTQKELAGKLYITHQAVSNWEKGKALPDIGILSQLGDIYGISIDNLLLKVKIEDKEKPMVLRRIVTFFGLIMSLYFVSAFLYYDRHIVTSIIFIVFMLILSLVFSYLMKQRKWWLEYLIITLLLVTISLIVIPKNLKFYMLDDTNYLIIQDEIPIENNRQFDELSQTVDYYYILETYTMIYTPGEPNIDIINLSKYDDGDLRIYQSGNMNIYDVIVYDDIIYFSTFDEEIPGEFKLFILDFDTLEIELVHESQEVLRMYKAFEQLYLVSDPHLETNTKIYQYDFITKTMSEAIEVDYTIYSLTEYFVEYESYILMSVSNNQMDDYNNKIVLADYNFDVQHTIYEADPGIVHMLFSDYGQVLLGTDEGIIVFEDMEYYTLGDDYSRWPEIVGPEWIRNEQYLYQLNYETERFELYSDVPYYSKDLYEMGAKFLVYNELDGNFFGIDNNVIELIHFQPYEIDDVYIESTTRIILYSIGIITYGFFLILGHKRK